MPSFLLNANVKLGKISNVRQFVNQLNRSVPSVPVNISLQPGISGNLRSVKSQLQSVGRSAKSASVNIGLIGDAFKRATERFGIFVVATSVFRNFINNINQGLRRGIEFEREMIRIGQVTGVATKNLKDVRDEINRLSTSFGVNSEELAKISVTFAQAGFSIDETKRALDALAKSNLAPTFSSIEQTSEGGIAALRQFRLETSELEGVISSINQIASKFAVESSDLISVIRRAGGAFQATGGDLNELLALFTSVRQTTRESADSIATGFRTIFTRLQRGSTVSFLSDLGIELRETNGQFVGGYEAVRRLSSALKELSTTDPRFSQIIEELGGFRQVSKVIPLITQFEVAERALIEAQRGNNSLSEDAVRAQESLSVQISKTREEFEKLFRVIIENDGVKGFINTLLDLAQAIAKVGQTLEPVLSSLLALGGLAAVRLFPPAIAAAAPTFSSQKKFNRGGSVGGNGNRDTVPALLTPGEFVINKNAASKLGPAVLNQLNRKNPSRFASGGLVGGVISGAGSVGLAIAPILFSLTSTFDSLSDSMKNFVLQVGGATAAFAFFNNVANNLPISKFNNSLEGLQQQLLVAGSQKTGAIQGLLRTEGAINSAKSQRAKLASQVQSIINSSPFGQFGVLDPKDQAEVNKLNSAIGKLDKRIAGLGITKRLRSGQADAALDVEDRINEGIAFNESEKRFQQQAQTIGLIGGVAGSFIGSEIQSFASSRISRGEDQVAAGTFGGALAGAGQGALVGSTLGPLGTALGALTGAVYSGVTAFINFSRELETAKFTNGIKNFEDAISRLAKGTSDLDRESLNIRDGLLRIQDRLASVEGDDFQTLNSIIDNSVSNIQPAIQKLANSVSSFAEFTAKAGPDTLELFARISKLNLSELEAGIKATIQANRQAKEFQERLNQETQAAAERVRGIIAFSRAIDNAASVVDNFIITVNGIQSRSANGPFGVNEQSIDRAQNIAGFLPGADRFVAELQGANRIQENLYNFLLNLQSNPLEGESGSFIQRARTFAEGQGLDSNDPVFKNFIAAFRNELGASESDSDLGKRLDTDFFGVLDNLSKGLTNVGTIFESLDKLSTDSINRFAGQLDKASSFLSEIDNLVLSRAGLIDQAIRTRATFAGQSTPNFSALNSLQRTQSNFVTGGLNAQQLGRDLQNFRQQLAQANQDVQNAGNFQQAQQAVTRRQQLLDTITRTTNALEFLANVSDRVALQEEQLAKIRSDREKKFNFASDFTFGSNADRRDIGRTIQEAIGAVRRGNLEGVDTESRRNIQQLFKTFADVRLFDGLTGQQAEKRIVRGEALAAGISPELAGLLSNTIKTPQQQQLEGQVNNAFAEAAKAQEGLLRDAQGQRNALITAVNTGFNQLPARLAVELQKVQTQQEQQQQQQEQKQNQQDQRLAAARNQLRQFGLTEKDTGLVGGINKFVQAQQNVNQVSALRGRAEGLLDEFINNPELSREAFLAQSRSTLGLSDDEFQQFRSVVDSNRIRLVDQQYADQLQRAGFNVPVTNQRQFLSSEGIPQDLRASQIDETLQRFVDTRISSANENAKFASRSLPSSDSVDIGLVVRNIQKINKLFEILGKNQFNSGGLVGGSGNSDTVPAMLTPGEYVLNKKAVKKVGLTALQRANAKGYQTGGLVDGGGVLLDSSFLNGVREFSSTSEKLINSLNNFPREVIHTINGRVELILNGADVLSRIMPSVQEMIVAKIDMAIREFTKKNFIELA